MLFSEGMLVGAWLTEGILIALGRNSIFSGLSVRNHFSPVSIMVVPFFYHALHLCSSLETFH